MRAHGLGEAKGERQKERKARLMAELGAGGPN
jgi:hypothetical protein